MEWIFFALAGIIQGAAEWVPISSEGLNFLVLSALGFEERSLLPLTVWLHVGTLAAAVVYFREDIKKLLSSFPKLLSLRLDENSKFLAFVVAATIVTSVVGLPIYHAAKEASSINGSLLMALIGLCMVITGLLQKIALKKVRARRLSLLDSIALGVAQGFSVLPGLSRSGLTIAALMFLGYKPEDSLRISFITGIPAIALSSLYLAWSGEVEGFAISSIIGVALALIVGHATIRAFMKAALRLKAWIFCVLAGFLCFIPLMLEAISLM